jgi:hypothetical protein
MTRPLNPPGKTQYPLYWRLGGLQGQSGWAWKILPPPGLDPRTVQPIAKSLHQLCYKQILKRDNYSTANLAVFNFEAHHTIFSMCDISRNLFILIRPSLMSQDTSSLLDIYTTFKNFHTFLMIQTS